MSKDFEIILAADIGGTRARFALFETGGGVRLAHRVELETARHASFAGLLQAALEALAGHGTVPSAAVLAVAGPVERGRFCRPPNIAYAMDLDTLEPGLLPAHSVLINDFAAQAHGCRLFGQERSQEVLPGAMDPSLTQAVLGPGTGLGKAALVPDGRGGYVVCGSEGGHAAFPFNGPEEQRFQDFVLEITGEPYVRWEGVVSGQGLALLHRFLSGRKVSPAEAEASLEASSPVCGWFARLLGRACRDYVLEVMATGGLFISGGVAARNPVLLEHPEFTNEFRLSATHARLLGNVPVRLVRDQDVGLWGAATVGAALLGRCP
ncbi:glucokinase [Fundidesulfovibrio terrae]|uniref:glucokinase n=1 Tax=Fundidesulfovibrio terrae TaxID=2922866 RepID=UPI001FAFE66C|nr:glucokinase [Fundidesulfovibrio terrae]